MNDELTAEDKLKLLLVCNKWPNFLPEYPDNILFEKYIEE